MKVGDLSFSANLGFLWTDHLLSDAVRAAKRAGFDAIECHWPYSYPAEKLRASLTETGLTLCCLNTSRGDVSAGQFGLSALPGCEDAARAAIDQAISYAHRAGARSVHVMAGNASGSQAQATFIENLHYAADQAGRYDLSVLIEPLNPYDAPAYFLRETGQAADIIATVDQPNLRMMFDCYHVARTEGDVIGALGLYSPLIGHIQFAGVPERGMPDRGTLDYNRVFATIAEMHWQQPLGAEYRFAGRTEDSLEWLRSLRRLGTLG